MFRILSDTLPGFAPFPISSYDSVIWASEIQRDSSSVLPSVAVADFDGDGQSDVAMFGLSHDSTAQIMLVSNASHGIGPRLIFLVPARWPIGSDKPDVLLRSIHQGSTVEGFKLRKEAVEKVDIGKGAVIYFLENGVLTQIPIGD
jgi:hypothetical protein